MKFLISCTVVCALVALVVCGELAQARLSARHDWHAYKRKYGKAYDSPEEDARRFALFMRSKAKIEALRGRESHERGLNHLSDWTEAELQQLRGYKLPGGKLRERKNSPEAERFLSAILEAASGVPDAVDWRKVPGRVSAVKNQGKCGSCWAFASTGVLEGQEVVVLVGNKSLVPLSEQDLMDCTNESGCDGGAVEFGIEGVARMGGIESELDYPYQAKDQKCKFDPSKSFMNVMGSAILLSQDFEQMKKVVATYGPIATGINADHLFDYKSGIVDDPKCEDGLDHAVLIVGYGTDPKQGDYWIVKNSWGAGWGEQGYFRIRRGKNRCGIEWWPVIAVV